MMAAIGSVLAMPAAGWLINKFGSQSIVIGSTLGIGLALPLIAESNTVLNTVGRSSFLWGDGWFDGCSDEYSRRDAREAIPASHHVVIPCLFSLGGMAGPAFGGLVASRAVPESEFPGTNFEEVHGDLREADF